jgi:membrane fusion protein, multidrug efflux system
MTQPPTKTTKRKWPAIVLVILTLALLVWVVGRIDSAPRTDDAYVYADTIEVVPEVSGRIVNLAVRDNQSVNKGDLLFAIDAQPYLAALARSKASLAALDQQIALTQRTVDAQQYNAASLRAAVGRAKAAAAQASDTLRRMEPLLPNGYVSAEDVDRARTAQRATRAESDAAELQARQATAAVGSVDALIAQRAVILAEISMAQLNVDHAAVVSPFDGRVVSLKTSTGQFVSALRPVFTLVDTRRWYVIANFRETELRHIKAGMRATIYLMTDSDIPFNGVVESIGYGVLPDDGGLSIGGLPRIQRSLNWVRVAQRFPVRILMEHPDPALFRIGVSAVAVLHPDERADRR